MGGRGVHVSPQPRAAATEWWGTSMPKKMGGTPEQLGRMWGAVRGEEKWRLDRTGAPEGWLGEGRGAHAWRDLQRLGCCGGGSVPSVCPAQLAPGSLLGSRAGSSALQGHRQATLVLGA